MLFEKNGIATILAKTIATKIDSDGRVAAGKMNLTEAVALAIRLEANVKSIRNSRKSRNLSHSYNNYDRRNNNNQRRSSSSNAQVNHTSATTRDHHDSDSDYYEGESNDDPGEEGQVNNTRSFNSKGPRNYNSRTRSLPPRPASMPPAEYEKLIQEGKCLNCKQSGHVAWKCPKANPSPANTNGNKDGKAKSSLKE